MAANNLEPRIKKINVTEDTIEAYLVDGLMISVPLAWSWRLSEATPEQRNNWGNSSATVKACIGPTLTKTSAPKACCTAFPRDARSTRLFEKARRFKILALYHQNFLALLTHCAKFPTNTCVSFLEKPFVRFGKGMQTRNKRCRRGFMT